MWMKNFVIPNLEWNKHHSRHRSSGDRVSSKHRQQQRVVETPPLCIESNPESSQVQSPACDGLMASSLRRHSSVGNDDTGVSSSKCKKPVIEYSRQPRNSVSKNGELQSDQLAGVKKVEVRKNGLVLGEKGSRSMNISVPVRKKNSLNNDKDNTAMEITAERKKNVVLVKEEDREQIGVMVAGEGKEIGFMAVEEEEKETEVMEVEEEGKETEGMASKEEEEEEEEEKDVGAISDAKTWNFRPRNPIRRSLNLNGSNFGFGRLMVTPKCPSPKKPEVENKKESVKKKDQNKRCLAAILTKEEIKEDWRQWAQLGIRPPKKHIKRPKCVQKQVDNIYPGAYINSVPVTSDLYRVSKKDVGLM